jgi:hypothetical protein
VRRSCQVRVRAVYLLCPGATRLIPCIRSCRLLTGNAEETKVSLCYETHYPGRCSRLHRCLAAGSLEALSTPLRRLRRLSMLAASIYACGF